MCPTLYNIYGMKLNEGHFPLGTVTINFWDKPYQEVNFKSHLNSVVLSKQGKIQSDLHISHFILIFVRAHFYNKM